MAVDSLQIQSIDDKGSGYINSLAAPHQAAVQQQAKIAQAKADQAAAEAQQASAQKQAEYARATAVKQAEYRAEIDRAQATAQAQQAVLEEQAKVAAKNAELREAELVAEVVKPAEADAERIRTLAQAEADRTKMSAEAAAAEGRIALDQTIIAQLPQTIEAAASGPANANVTILNGTEGLNDAVAQLAAQGATILRTVMDGLSSATQSPDAQPSMPAPNGSTSPQAQD